MPWISWISSPLKNDANHLRPQEFRAQRNLASYSRSDFRTWLTDKKCREQPGNLRNSRMLHENRGKNIHQRFWRAQRYSKPCWKKINQSVPAICHKFSSGSSCATRLKQKLGKFSCLMSSVQCPVAHSKSR